MAKGNSTAVTIGLWTMAALSVGVALAAIRYLIPGAPGGAPPVLGNAAASYGILTAHAAVALIAMAIGPFQFFRKLRNARPALHRRMGQVYVLCCLIGGAAGLTLAIGTTSGPIATAGFGLLALGWMFSTFKAWRHAVKREIAIHEQWMIRSFAFCFAAVTLRLYLIPVGAFGLDFYPAFRVISFACWVPNILIAEWIIASRRKPARA
jgi:uncharacterized membrane protein